MWYYKNQVYKTKTGKLIGPSQAGGFLNIESSHSLGEIAAKSALKELYNLGRIRASKAIKSDFAKRKIKGTVNKYLDQALDSFTLDLSKKLDPVHGRGVDVHALIGKLPKPKGGWTLPGHKYTGPYNDLDSQVKYDPTTGQILEVYDKPTGRTDAIAMQHDVDYSVCKDDRKCKNRADRKMVQALDEVPYNERQWVIG